MHSTTPTQVEKIRLNSIKRAKLRIKRRNTMFVADWNESPQMKKIRRDSILLAK